jgi:hypothetical protein
VVPVIGVDLVHGGTPHLGDGVVDQHGQRPVGRDGVVDQRGAGGFVLEVGGQERGPDLLGDRCAPVAIILMASPTMRSGAPSGLAGPWLPRSARRSAPVQKCRPVAVSTTQRTFGSALA